MPNNAEASVNADRDELMRLVQQLPDNMVPLALAALRQHQQPESERLWPPAFFASAPGDGVPIADQLLHEDFGR